DPARGHEAPRRARRRLIRQAGDCADLHSSVAMLDLVRTPRAGNAERVARLPSGVLETRRFIVPVPETMRAAVLRDDAPRLEVMEIPTPKPRAGEVLVQVIACGVCHTDLHVIKGEVAFP